MVPPALARIAAFQRRAWLDVEHNFAGFTPSLAPNTPKPAIE